ncbi:MAG: flagellar motor switch protein FliM [Paracoccaceae bacterium]|jgi:flagellar motor switch protein FliM
MADEVSTLQKMMTRKTHAVSPVLAQVGSCFEMALSKAVRQLFDVNAGFEPADNMELLQKAVLDAAPTPGLLVVIKTPDGRTGLLTLDGMLVNALVELMTGASDRAVYKQARVPTVIDVALCKEFCGLLLKLFPNELAKVVGQVVLPNLTWSETEVEAVKLSFILENSAMLRLSGMVSFQDGIRGGEISLALPTSTWASGGDIKPAKQDNGWAKKLADNVLNTHLPLRANLETLHMPLSAALALRPGDHLAISSFALSDLGLSSLDGSVILHGRLGQENGKKAICVTRSASSSSQGPVLNLQPAMPNVTQVSSPDDTQPVDHTAQASMPEDLDANAIPLD